MTELWLPGRHDDFVDAVTRQIARFMEENGTAVVEVELRDGSTLAAAAIRADPGGGFVTIVPHADEPQEVIVPLIAVARVTLSSVRDDHPLGFAVPQTSAGPPPS